MTPVEFVANDDLRCGTFVVDYLRGIQSLWQFGKFRAVGYKQSVRMVCGVVYNNFTGHNVHMHIVSTSPVWVTRRNIVRLLQLPFDWGCVRITAFIARKNKKARRLAERVGFKHEGTMRKGYDGQQDLMVYGLFKEDCKWLSTSNSSTPYSGKSTSIGSTTVEKTLPTYR